MLPHLIFFEWKFYTRKISFYVMLMLFFAMGIVTGTSAGIAFPHITYNSPYAINFIVGLFSLASLFPIVIMASQSLLREQDSRFEEVLYTTPITIRNYFISRLMLVFGVTVFAFVLFLAGYITGHLMSMDKSSKWGDFHVSYYLHTFVVIVLPNIFLCTVIVCCTAWRSKNKMLIYLSGLGIYVLYMVVSIFSNSPLIAGASPASASAMQLAAKLDPFGMAAFFEQTHHWTALERNNNLLYFSGNLLINRAGVLLIACCILFMIFRSYHFSIHNKQKKKILLPDEKEFKKYPYQKTIVRPTGHHYFIATICSFLKIDLKYTIKSISFILLTVITLFVTSMEMYGAIEGGVRLPENYVTSGLMINTILATIPILLLSAMLFYGSELVWKSKQVNFAAMENATGFTHAALFISKIVTLLAISFVLISCCIVLALLFQLVYQYPVIEWKAYGSLFYFIGLPAALCGMFVIALQYMIGNKYIALSIAAIFLLLTNSSLGKAFGFSHPLLRFANFLPDGFSDINRFGYLPNAFAVTMVYSLSFALLVAFITTLFYNRSFLQSIFTIKWKQALIISLPLIVMVLTGLYITTTINPVSKKEQLNWQQQYEEKYKAYQFLPQPYITDVRTTIDLYPGQNKYQIKGNYTLVNKTTGDISEILINTSKEISWHSIASAQLTLIKKDDTFGQWLFKTHQPMLPGDSINLDFDFEYSIEPLKGHQSFNAIVENGSFMRISNYFPATGYDSDNEITDANERKKRGLPLQLPLTKVDAPLSNPYNYGFINFDAMVSTDAGQTAVAVGELTNSYSKNNRNYFHYKAGNIPFRFAVASAKYAVQKSNYNNIAIEVLYHPNHYHNINQLTARIKQSLAYCETNFGPYPYKTIRFAEISNFTDGFAATAYPAGIFISEKYLHLNMIKGKDQDVISELAGHELSHQWWGNAQLKPDYREGSGILTETLAKYTELMLYKNVHGTKRMEAMVNLHKELYESEKAFSGESPLYTSNAGNTNVLYNKGLFKMYELYLLIGEEKINRALKNLLAKHRFPLQPATSLDLIAELKAVADTAKHAAVDKIFME
jgi:ABC-2 type transport system permease protein